MVVEHVETSNRVKKLINKLNKEEQYRRDDQIHPEYRKSTSSQILSNQPQLGDRL